MEGTRWCVLFRLGGQVGGVRRKQRLWHGLEGKGGGEALNVVWDKVVRRKGVGDELGGGRVGFCVWA